MGLGCGTSALLRSRRVRAARRSLLAAAVLALFPTARLSPRPRPSGWAGPATGPTPPSVHRLRSRKQRQRPHRRRKDRRLHGLPQQPNSSTPTRSPSTRRLAPLGPVFADADPLRLCDGERHPRLGCRQPQLPLQHARVSGTNAHMLGGSARSTSAPTPRPAATTSATSIAPPFSRSARASKSVAKYGTINGGPQGIVNQGSITCDSGEIDLYNVTNAGSLTIANGGQMLLYGAGTTPARSPSRPAP